MAFVLKSCRLLIIYPDVGVRRGLQKQAADADAAGLRCGSLLLLPGLKLV